MIAALARDALLLPASSNYLFPWGKGGNRRKGSLPVPVSPRQVAVAAAPQSRLRRRAAQPRASATPSRDSGPSSPGGARLPPGSSSTFEGAKWLATAALGDLRAFYRRRFARNGQTFLTNILFKPTVVVGGGDSVRHLLARETAGDIKNVWPPGFMELIGKNAILFLPQGGPHEQLRRIAAPAFSRRAVAAQFPRVLRLASAAVREWCAASVAEADGHLQLHPRIKELFLRIVVSMVLGDISEESFQVLSKNFTPLVEGLLQSGSKFERAKAARVVLVAEISRIIGAEAVQSHCKGGCFPALEMISCSIAPDAIHLC